jgi:hypothetical protein
MSRVAGAGITGITDCTLWKRGLSIPASAKRGMAWASSDSDRFNNGQRENRTWFYPTLRFLIVCSCQENKQLTIPLLGTVAALRARSEPTGVAKNLANLASAMKI